MKAVDRTSVESSPTLPLSQRRSEPSDAARSTERLRLVPPLARVLRVPISALAVSNLLLAVPLAHADDENPETLIRQGVQLRKKGQNEKAHGYFQRAYDLGHTPRSAAQLGLSDVTLSQWQEADSLLTEALASADPWVATNRAAVEKGRTLARGHLGSVKLTNLPDGASAEVGKQTAVNVADGAVLWALPGRTVLRIRADGYKVFEQEMTFEVGKTIDLRANLQALPKPPPLVAKSREPGLRGQGPTQPPPHGAAVGSGHVPHGPDPQVGTKTAPPVESPEDDGSRGAYRVASYVAGGVGVVALGSGFALWTFAGKKVAAIKSDADAGRPYNEGNTNFTTFDKAGVGLMIGGGVALVGGLVGFLLTSPSESATEKTTPRGGIGLNVSGSTRAWQMGLSGSF